MWGKLRKKFICQIVPVPWKQEIPHHPLSILWRPLCINCSTIWEDWIFYSNRLWPMLLSCILLDSRTVFFSSTIYLTMHVSHEVFNTLIAPSGPDILISFYHECLHLIAFTHAKILSIPCHKFIDPTHLLMMTVLQWFVFSHIGIVNFFSHFSLAFYTYISSLNYSWLMMTSRISCLHLTNFQPLILMMFSVCRFNNLDDTFISSNPSLFLNFCITGNMVICHWIFPSYWRCTYDCCWGYPHLWWCSDYDLATSQTCW